MPRRKANSIRRRQRTDVLTSEAVEVLITGDIEGGAMVAFADRRYPFKNEDEARACWERHYRTVLRVLTSGEWDPKLGPINYSLEVEMGHRWRGQKEPWAQSAFGIPGETPAKGT